MPFSLFKVTSKIFVRELKKKEEEEGDNNNDQEHTEVKADKTFYFSFSCCILAVSCSFSLNWCSFYLFCFCKFLPCTDNRVYISIHHIEHNSVKCCRFSFSFFVFFFFKNDYRFPPAFNSIFLFSDASMALLYSLIFASVSFTLTCTPECHSTVQTNLNTQNLYVIFVQHFRYVCVNG